MSTPILQATCAGGHGGGGGGGAPNYINYAFTGLQSGKLDSSIIPRHPPDETLLTCVAISSTMVLLSLTTMR